MRRLATTLHGQPRYCSFPTSESVFLILYEDHSFVHIDTHQEQNISTYSEGLVQTHRVEHQSKNTRTLNKIKLGALVASPLICAGLWAYKHPTSVNTAARAIKKYFNY